MVITERLATLRREMAQHGMNGYVVVTDDFHGSEYVGDFSRPAPTCPALPAPPVRW